VFKVSDLASDDNDGKARGLKAQKRLAQGKRSDTLGQSTFVSDALKGQKL